MPEVLNIQHPTPGELKEAKKKPAYSADVLTNPAMFSKFVYLYHAWKTRMITLNYHDRLIWGSKNDGADRWYEVQKGLVPWHTQPLWLPRLP
jgi:hypothetical protein